MVIVKTEDLIKSNLWRLFPVINVDAVKDIPCNYPGAMGVPITFIDKYNSEQFEILDLIGGKLENGRRTYKRIIIRNLSPELPEEIDLEEWLKKCGVTLELDFKQEGD